MQRIFEFDAIHWDLAKIIPEAQRQMIEQEEIEQRYDGVRAFRN